MPSLAERHQQVREGKGPMRPDEVARLREELEGLKARSAEIEAKLDPDDRTITLRVQDR